MTVENIEQTIEEIAQLLGEGRRSEAVEIISSLMPADKATLFEYLNPDMQRYLLPSLDATDTADILEELDDDEAVSVAEQLSADALTDALDEMEPDEAADLLGDMTPEMRVQALEGMSSPEQVQPLLRYPDDSAGGLMTSDYYVFPQDARAGEIIRTIRSQPAPDEEIPYVYSIDDEGHLTGVTRLADLIRAHPEQPLLAIIQSEIVSIAAHEDQEFAARLLNRYDLMAIPVLDAVGRLVGVIRADDAMAALQEEAIEDMYMAAGIVSIGGQEAAKGDLLVRGPIWRAWWVRIPFLVITMAGGMLAGAVIGLYQEALETITALALFVPVVMNMGGSAGIQSTAIFIRGHALEQIDTSRFYSHLLRELTIGAGMGLILGTIAGIVAALWQSIPELGLVVGLAMALTMTLAVTMGFLIPYLLIKLGVDPAAGADPLITTIKDITGLFIYFSLAYLFLGHLL